MPSTMYIPGLGDPTNQPKSRVLGTSFFGLAPDAFSMKTPLMSSERAKQPPSVADKNTITPNNKVI